MFRYVWRELVRNPRRTVVSLSGVIVGTALLAAVLFFIDGSAATMTRRAIAPLPIDMQRAVSAPVGEQLQLEEIVSATDGVSEGETVAFTVRFDNRGDAAQNEVTVRDAPPEGFTYVPDSTRLNGSPVPDVRGEPPLAHGPAALGMNLGTVPGGTTVELSYEARAERDIQAGDILLDATVATREHLNPLTANRPESLGLLAMAERISTVPGVASADALSFVDVPPRRLSANGKTIDRPIRVFAFDRSYAEHHSAIIIDQGSFEPDTALLSIEAARTLQVEPGSSVQLSLPGTTEATSFPVGGLVDLSAERALFWSRKTAKFEDFLYVPDSLVVSHEDFERIVLPAYRAARADRSLDVKSFPVSEVDIQVVRSQLDTDPANALAQTEAIAGRIEQIGPAEGNLIDNISNTLQVARADAMAGKRMFLFLGLPGGAVAACLAAYAASVLGAVQRRERAVLRVHGAHRRHLLRLHAYRTALFSTVGSALGVMVGFLAVLAVLGGEDLFAASPWALALSASIAAVTGVLVTSAALYVPGRRSLGREISEEHRQLETGRTPAWQRWWLDIGLLVLGAIAGVIAFATGAFDTRATLVSTGQTTVLPSYLLVPSLVSWIGGALLSVRIIDAIGARIPLGGNPGYGSVVGGTLRRSLRRRSIAIATAAGGMALIVTLGVDLVAFAATYEKANIADARFALGADLRLTPNLLAERQFSPREADSLQVTGVTQVSPVMAEAENAVLVGRFDQNVQDLAAVDPTSLARVAPLPDRFFADGLTGDGAMAALAADPYAVLVRSDTADDLSIETGDDVEVLLARGTDYQTTAALHVIGLFDRFPGFPQGVDLIVDIDTFEAETGIHRTDFFLADVADESSAGTDLAIHGIQLVAGAGAPFGVEQSDKTLLKDQSSLTALNVRGLTTLDRTFTLLMATAVVGIFVFALMLQRRSEFATLHARGFRLRDLVVLVLGESLAVALTGTVAGLLVGIATAPLFVRILHPLFVVTPVLTIPAPGIAVIAGLPLIVGALAAVVAAFVVRHETSERLRES